jgi:hypothetical protein
MEAILGPSLVNKAGEKTATAAALAGAEYVGIYFSAHVSPPSIFPHPPPCTPAPRCPASHTAYAASFRPPPPRSGARPAVVSRPA